MSHPAAFLDRDGTIIVDADYPADPDAVRLIDGAADAIRRLNAAGIPVIVVTNQSGIARGSVTEAQYQLVRERLDSLLAAEGARIDASYHCPHHPDFGSACDCRKPASGMYRRAIREHDLDPERSLFVGDRWRDVAPGLELGGWSVLIRSAHSGSEDIARATEHARVRDSLDAAVTEWLRDR